MRPTPTAAAAAAIAVLAAMSACSSSGSRAPTTTPTSANTTSRSGAAPTSASDGSAARTSHAPGSPAQRLLDAMSLKQRVGQLLMVDCPSSGVADATVSAIRTHAVGSVILDGTTSSGVDSIRRLTGQLERDNTSDAQLFIATDQEGGQVQRLQGAGFSTIPSGVAQGQLDPGSLRARAKSWGSELKSAGVNVDLAPVLDTVPNGQGSNPPIGDLDREYGHDPSTVSRHGVAVARGLADGGVVATVKHFPGLGRVRGNTDTTSGVTDSVTTEHDAYLAPFKAAVDAEVPFVMMSTAIYSRIDPDTPAAFSKTIVTGMLRDSLGFDGVVISDDIGAAKQVSSYGGGDRAVRFVAAGGDIVLTVDASQAGDMTAALIAKAKDDPAFEKLVDAAALRVLEAKAAQGLLG